MIPLPLLYNALQHIQILSCFSLLSSLSSLLRPFPPFYPSIQFTLFIQSFTCLVAVRSHVFGDSHLNDSYKSGRGGRESGRGRGCEAWE